MIAVAVVASIVAYAWVMGYIGGQTQKTGNQIQIQSYSAQGNLILYVQNTGQGTVHLKQDGSVYVNDVLKTIRAVDDQTCDDGAKIPISVGQTVKVEVNYDQYKLGDRIKVVTIEGTTMEITGGSGGTSGTSGGSSNQPIAGFTFNPASPRVGQNVMFTDTSSGGSGINQWSWNFGDGATSTERNPIHSYSSLGSKTVTLSVTDSNGKTGTATHTLMVSDFTAPTASFTFTVDGQTVSFTDTSTSGSGTVNHWSWNFGDSGTSTAQNPTHLYSTIGQKTVTLTITDSNGKTSTTSRTVNVGVDAPTAQFTMSTSNPNVGQSVAFTDTSLPASTGTINQWSWVFGDGGTSTTQNPAHSYSTPGQKTITLTVTDTNGKTSTASNTLTVNDYVAPAASFTYSPANPIVDQTVSFTDKSTPGSGTINQWSWNFGSGATPGTSTNQNPSASFASEGQKTISLTVTDSNGKTSVATQTIQIYSEPTPTPTPSPTPTATAQVTFAVSPAGSGTTSPSGPQTYNVGQSVPISATANTGYAFSSWTFTGSIQVTTPSSASTNAIINGAGIITANFIQAGNNKLSFTAGTSQTLQVNAPSAKITVQRQTSSGTPVTAGSTTVSLTASAGAFYFDSACTSQITLVTIDNPQSTADFYYKSSTSGTSTLTASATGYQPVSTTFTINSLPTTAQVTFAVSPAGSGTTNPSGTQTYNVGATIPISATANTGYTFSSWGFNGNIQISNANSASTSAQINGAGTITANFVSTSGNRLVFTAGTSQTLVVFEPSAKITVQRRDASGTAINSGTTTVNLATTSNGGKFYSDAACTTQITSVTINSGQNSRDFYYRDSNEGTPTLTASASSYQPVSTTVSIGAATPEIGLTTGFDGTPWDSEWRSWPNPPWTSATDYYVSGPNSAKATRDTQGAFSSNKVDATGAAYITVSFYYRVTATDQTDFQIRYGATRTDNYDSITWHLITSLGSAVPNQWQYYTVTITDTSAFTDYFRFQFVSQSLSSNAAIWVDNVQIVVNR